jgi:hypothetical protein
MSSVALLLRRDVFLVEMGVSEVREMALRHTDWYVIIFSLQVDEFDAFDGDASTRHVLGFGVCL